jgi:hypothetical protein
MIEGWEYLRTLAVQCWSYHACGDVHGISLESVPDLRTKLGEGFNCAIVVRDPLSRLKSQMALFEEFPVKSVWNVGYVQRFIDQGVRLPHDDLENRRFLHGVNMLNKVIEEERAAPIWRSEDLTSDPSALCGFIEELTHGHVRVEPEWAERAVRRPASNQHSRPKDSAREFQPWQIEAMIKIIEPDAWRIYEKLGYKTPDFIT